MVAMETIFEHARIQEGHNGSQWWTLQLAVDRHQEVVAQIRRVSALLRVTSNRLVLELWRKVHLKKEESEEEEE